MPLSCNNIAHRRLLSKSSRSSARTSSGASGGKLAHMEQGIEECDGYTEVFGTDLACFGPIYYVHSLCFWVSKLQIDSLLRSGAGCYLRDGDDKWTMHNVAIVNRKSNGTRPAGRTSMSTGGLAHDLTTTARRSVGGVVIVVV